MTDNYHPKLEIAVIADDLTGAADTGVQFAKRGLCAVLFPLGLEDVCVPPETQAAAFNTNTRGVQADLAHNRVKDASILLMRAFQPRNIYKKIDSTLRGNLGVEIEAVLGAADREFAILAPAFPACGRKTVGGIHFVNDQPLALTEAARDPVSPVNESYIPAIVRSQTRLKVGHIELEDIRRGPDHLKQVMLRRVNEGEKIIVFDSVNDEDLSSIAKAGLSMSIPPLMVGSAGLANQISAILRPDEPEKQLADAGARDNEGMILIVSGSLSDITSGQLRKVVKTGRGRIFPVDLWNRESVAGLVSEVISAAEASQVVGIQSVRENARNSLPASLVVEQLGEIALKIVRECPRPLRGLILSGGDTALGVFACFGIALVRLRDEILPGVPYGQVVGGEFAGMGIITKAGAFGDENALISCIDFLIPR